jgi:hypothetical protein
LVRDCFYAFVVFFSLCSNITYRFIPLVVHYSQQYQLNFVGHFFCGCSGSTDYFPAMVDVVVVHRNDDIVIFAT